MRSIFLFCVSVFISSGVFSQTVIRGWVKDSKMKPLAGASIAVKNGYDGAVADSAGNYSFSTTDKGSDTIIITIAGYDTLEKVVVLSNEPVSVNAVLKEQFNELRAVTITAGSFSAGDNKKGVVMSSLDILTTSTNADISSAMRTLPGTQQNGEQAGLFVHGGTAGETAQYMDGAIIANPYYSGGPQIMQRGRFDPRLFSGTMFATGGYSALYGNAMSSVLLMNSNDLPDKSEFEIDASPIAYLDVRTQQLAKDKQSAFGASYNYINVWPEMQALPTYYHITNTPVYHTANFYYHRKTKGGMIKYYTEFSHNDVGYQWQDIDSLYLHDRIHVKNNNWYNNLNWTQSLGNRWKMMWANSFSINGDNIERKILDNAGSPVTFDQSAFWMNNKIFNYLNTTDNLQSRLVFEKRLKHLNAVRFGGEYDYDHTNIAYNQKPVKYHDNYGALFAESDIYFTNDFMLKAGVRGERSALVGETKVTPRISTAYKVGDNAQLSAAYGIFYQKPDENYMLYNRNLKFSRSDQYILNYQRSTNNQILRVEAYYKKYSDLIKLIPATQVNDYPYNNNGNGHAEGLDLFWKDQKTFPFKYWLSYSYIYTRRNFLNYATALQPDFITPHTFSAVVQQFIPNIKTQVNFSYSFATGRPYYYFQPDLNSRTYSLTHQEKTSDYNNLDFSIDYLPDFAKKNKKMTVMFVATVKNILGLQQLYTYNYSYNGSYKQPVWPISKQQYFIGVFFNFGKDRSQEIINENM